jgi:hypothetical protein
MHVAMEIAPRSVTVNESIKKGRAVGEGYKTMMMMINERGDSDSGGDGRWWP